MHDYLGDGCDEEYDTLTKLEKDMISVTERRIGHIGKLNLMQEFDGTMDLGVWRRRNLVMVVQIRPGTLDFLMCYSVAIVAARLNFRCVIQSRCALSVRSVMLRVELQRIASHGSHRVRSDRIAGFTESLRI